MNEETFRIQKLEILLAVLAIYLFTVVYAVAGCEYHTYKNVEGGQGYKYPYVTWVKCDDHTELHVYGEGFSSVDVSTLYKIVQSGTNNIKLVVKETYK